jgi:hypothetical protein
MQTIHPGSYYHLGLDVATCHVAASRLFLKRFYDWSAFFPASGRTKTSVLFLFVMCFFDVLNSPQVLFQNRLNVPRLPVPTAHEMSLRPSALFTTDPIMLYHAF